MRRGSRVILAIFLLVVGQWGCGSGEDEVSLKSAPPSPIVDREQPADDSSRVQTEPRAPHPDDWFEDVTESSGVSFTHRNGREAGRFLMIESFGGGTAIVDFDLDDDMDLFLTGGGDIFPEKPPRITGRTSGLFRNEGEFRFSEITSPAGFEIPVDYSQGCAVADYNVDGFPDLLVCCYRRSRLYCNQGDGTFIEVDQEQLPASGWATAAAFGDANQDGFPDLMITRYTDWTPETDLPCYYEGVRDLCGPMFYSGTTCQYFQNSGNGFFTDRSLLSGILDKVHGMGVVATDLNDDGLIDFYVTSDGLPNHLYLGTEGSALKECGVLAGVALGEWGQSEAGMGVDVGDFDGDGTSDIFVTNWETEDNALYRNVGTGRWIHCTAATGLAGVSRMQVGFGTALSDFDNDGWLDLFVSNGNPLYTTAETPYRQRAQLFQNRDGKRFADISSRGGPYFAEFHGGRGCAAGDLNNDGAVDLVTVPINEPVCILRNRNVPQNFLRVRLSAIKGDRDATGARVSCEFSGRTLVKWVTKGAGYFSQGDARIVFPAESEVDAVDVVVSWPGRRQETFRGLSTRQTHHLVEGGGETLP